jgi:hypothetical protein
MLHRKRQHFALQNLSVILDRVILRAVFNRWIDSHRKCVTRHLALNNFIAQACGRLSKRCLIFWRVYAANAINKRRECFLMMLFNRWRLWTEERVEEKEKEHVALMHWASSLCLKTFCGLRVIVKQSKERRKDDSFLCNGSFLSSSTKALSNSGYLRTWSDAVHRPPSISFRSPERSMIFNKTPDMFSRLSMTSTELRPDRRYSHFDARDSNRCSSAKEYPIDRHRGFTNANHCALSNAQRMLSPSRESFSRDAGSSLGTGSAIRSRLSRSFTEKENGMPTAPFIASGHYQSSFINNHFSAAPCFSVGDTSCYPRNQKLAVIATLLNEMVDQVEHRHRSKEMHWYQQPTSHRYSGYAGCSEELYHRL